MRTKSGIAFLLCLLPALSFGQVFGLFKKNQLTDGHKHGRWVSYYGSDSTTVYSKGRYKHGEERGKWRYFYEDGTRAKKEIYRRNQIKTTNYHPNGKVRSSGQARLEDNPQAVEYFYFGDWKFYTPSGHLHKIVRYERGVEIGEQVF